MAHQHAIPPNIATGLAIVSVCVALIAVGRSLLPLPDDPPRSSLAACTSPVEVEGKSGATLGCNAPVPFAPCRPAASGDRLEPFAPGGCRRVRGGMRASWRVLLGLPLDLNTVTAEELTLLDGLGPAMAERIVQYRATTGPFPSIEAFINVHGVGPTTFAKLRPMLGTNLVGEPESWQVSSGGGPSKFVP